MALLERLTGIAYDPAQGTRIPVGPFFAMLHERLRGQVTNAQLVGAFALTSDDNTDLRALARRVHSQTAVYELPAGHGGLQRLDEIQDVVELAEAGIAPYTTLAAIRARLIEA